MCGCKVRKEVDGHVIRAAGAKVVWMWCVVVRESAGFVADVGVEPTNMAISEHRPFLSLRESRRG